MTYGWALLIVLIVAGVLIYFGVFSPGTLAGSTVSGFSEMRPIRAVYSANGGLTLNLENRCGDTAEVEAFYDITDSVTMDVADQNVTAGSRITVSGNTGLSAATGTAYTMNLAVEYRCSGILANSTGRISGSRS